MKTIALFGAGGKMGLRLAANLKGSRYEVRHVEIGERGRAALADRGITAMDADAALEGTEAVILAVPDNRIHQVLGSIEKKLAAGTLVIFLDIAAAYAGLLPQNPGLSLFLHASLSSADFQRRSGAARPARLLRRRACQTTYCVLFDSRAGARLCRRRGDRASDL